MEKIFELRNVVKTYKNDGKEFTALKDVSLTVEEGEIFGIIGMSGAGKSTLVRTLNRLEDVTSGEVLFYGKDLASLRSSELRSIRHSISMIFQGFNLLSQRTVIQNVEQSLKIIGTPAKARRQKAREMLEIVGLLDKENEYPARLSGGQKQRVAIARALAADPKVLLCDEATSALDPKITGEILDLLKKINQERKLTIIIITHEMAVVEKICDRVAIIDDGSLAEVGDVKEVFSNPKSGAAKKLVFPSNPFDPSDPDGKIVRIVFDGTKANVPFIANLVEETGLKVNILSANTRSVGGIGYGQMIVELPAYMSLQNTHSSVNNFPETFRLNMVSEHNLKGLLEALKKVAGNMSGGIAPNFKEAEAAPNLYCGVGSIALAFLFLTCKEIKIREKICSVLLLLFLMVSCIIRQLDYIWHGFHFTNMIPYRFSFLFSFVLLIMAYRAFLLWEQFKPWQIIVATGLSLGIIFCSDKASTAVFLVFNLVLLFLYISVLFYQVLPMPSRKKHNKEEQEKLQTDRRQLCTRTLAGVMVVELILNLVNYGIYFAGTNIENYPKGKADAAQAIEYMKELEKDNLFYRAEATHTQSLNDGALNGYNGITTFTSSAFVNVTEFMQALGYGAKDNYNRYCYEEASPVANLFLGLKYMLERDGYVEENSYFDEVGRFGKVALLENNAYLPLGFLANTELGDFKFTNRNNHFYFQNDLVEAATGISDVWKTLPDGKLQITASSGITLSTVYGYGFCRYTANSQGTVTFSYYPDTNGFFCVDIEQSKRNNFSVRKNGQFLYNDSYSLPK